MPRTRFISLAALVCAAVLLPATAAAANTAPNPFTATGAAWVDVPDADRIYLEQFDGNDYDDNGIFYVDAGISCTVGGITATGPFLDAYQVDETDCVDGDSNPVDPIDTSSRLGAVPLGFEINFFGTTYDSAYPNTNGGITFDAPNSDYDETLAGLADSGQTSGMYPLGADLYYASVESNFWVGSTTIGGNDAIVFSWEGFHNCCTSAADPEDMSFQLVLIDRGDGDFDAWFNFESLVEFDEGYEAPAVLIDLADGVSVGSNIFVAEDVSNVPAGCLEAYYDFFGTPTDAALETAVSTSGPYFRLEDSAARTISLWQDSLCTVPTNSTLVQDESADLTAYLQLEASNLFDAIGSGWSTYNPLTGEIDATELLFNIDATTLADSADNPLIERSLNTTVPGRFVIGQRDGGTVTDPDDLGGTPVEPEPELAATGADASPIIAGGIVLLLAGGAALALRRRRTA